VTTEGWIFMVGFRVFDVGLLIVWLIWFFRLRDDDDDSKGDDGGGGEGPDPRPGKDGPGARQGPRPDARPSVPPDSKTRGGAADQIAAAVKGEATTVAGTDAPLLARTRLALGGL
jgi:hypothetical protein